MKIKRDYKRLVDELLKINRHIIVDIIVNLYNLPALRKDFSKYFNSEINHENIVQAISEIANIIEFKHENGLPEFFEPIIKRNKQYIEFYGYQNFPIERLKEIFTENKCPAMHDEGLTPEMMIFYYYSQNMFNHKYIPELIKEYEYYFQLAEQARAKHKDYEKILKNSSSELPDIVELERYLFEEEDFKNIEDINWHDIAKKFGCEYDETTQRFNKVKRGFLIFYEVNIKAMKEAKYHYDSVSSVVEAYGRKIFSYVNKLNQVWKYCGNISKENRDLRTQLKTLRKQLNELDFKYKAISKASEQSKEKQLTELLKENYYLKTRIERLEQEIQKLEQAQEINKEISNDIIIPEQERKILETKKTIIPEYQTIVVVGGTWNSKEKEQLQQKLPTCDVKFVEAEKTIAKIDTISNADIVIFDTSRNAHKYFYIVKEKAKQLFFINKSNPDEVINLFSDQ